MPRKPIEIAVLDLMQTIGLLVRRVRAAAASQELSLTEYAVMARLAREGPATTADLARGEGMKPQSMGTTIAALEEMGMVERKPHPTDGRQVNIELTAKGLRYARAPRMRSGHGWRRPSPSSTNRNGKRCSRLETSSSAWWKRTSHEERTQLVKQPANNSDRPEAAILEARCRTPGGRCGTATSSCSFWPEHFGDRHLDDAAGDELAGLSADPFGLAAGHRQFRGADRFVCAGAVCRCVGGAPRIAASCWCGPRPRRPSSRWPWRR